ncbi:MAG: DUF4406 domain-containing protein [Treponema sp.]|nr:MAG: DUF4406 domain-containing protein [Treponema sp.]
MTCYISGPMTGIPEFNYPAFDRAKAMLVARGFTVLSPHEAPKSDSWEGYMRHDLKLVCDSDIIVMLPGWKKSRGALLEKAVADNLGLEAWFIEETPNSEFKLIQPNGFTA